MRIIGRCFAASLLVALLGMPAVAEPQSESPVATVLATGHLASVVALPVYFRLYRAHLPAAQRVLPGVERHAVRFVGRRSD